MRRSFRTAAQSHARAELELLGADSLATKAVRLLSPSLFLLPDASPADPGVSLALLTGDSGSGKSSLARALGHYFRFHPWTGGGVHLEWLSGKDISHLRPEDLKQRIQDSLLNAISKSPALLVLDDLDWIVPSQEEGL